MFINVSKSDFKKDLDFYNKIEIGEFKFEIELDINENYIGFKDGIIFGDIYHSSNLVKLHLSEIQNIHCLDIDEISKQFWGNYLIIKIENNNLKLYKSLNHSQNIFYTKSYTSQNCSFSFSNQLSKILEKSIDKSIDLSYIRTYLLYGDFISYNSPFKNIKHIPPGCCLSIQNDFNHKVSVVWNPFLFSDIKDDYRKTAYQEKVYSILESLVKTLITKYDNLILDYSGGLDSTSLLYILMNIKDSKNLALVHYTNNLVNSADELSEAINFSQKFNLDIFLYESSDCLPFLKFPQTNFKPNIISNILMYLSDEISLKNIIYDKYNYKNSLIIDGHGGDHLFSCPPIKTSVFDYYNHRGIIGLISQIKSVSIFDRSTLFEIIQLYYKNSFNNFFQNLPILDLFNFSKNESDFDIPFEYSLRATNKNLGKREYINNIYHIFTNNEIRTKISGINVISPLLSQPLVELMLSVPTFDLYGNGYDRIFFRELMHKEFKSQYPWRKNKGETTGLLVYGIKKNIDFIVSLVSNGILVRNHLINIDYVNNNLKKIQLGYATNLKFIVNIITVEIFFYLYKDIL